jgi:hypothetical protein
MTRYLTAILTPAVLLLVLVGPAGAQRDPRFPVPERDGWMGQSLAGNYINTSNIRRCQVYRRGRSYLFVNENGTPARFGFVGPNRLEMISGDWNPDTVVTIGRDRENRILLRFQEPGQEPGFWVQDR